MTQKSQNLYNIKNQETIMDLEHTCKKCGDCCRNKKIPFNLLDIFKTSTHLKITPNKFIQKYLKLTKDKESNSIYIIKEQPCPFLKDSQCTIEKIKPTTCNTTPCPKNKEYKTFTEKYGLMTLQFIQNTKEDMLTHCLNIEYTDDYLKNHNEFKTATAKEYLKNIKKDQTNNILKELLLKQIIRLGVHPKYQKLITER